MQKLNADIADLNCKGAAQGMFLSYETAKAVFALLKGFLQACQQNNDLPKYPIEEVLFQVAALIIEKEQGKILKKAPTLTYMPWDRKLQWTTEQIEQAKQNIGIGDKKFIINKINFLS